MDPGLSGDVKGKVKETTGGRGRVKRKDERYDTIRCTGTLERAAWGHGDETETEHAEVASASGRRRGSMRGLYDS